MTDRQTTHACIIYQPTPASEAITTIKERLNPVGCPYCKHQETT